MTNELDTKPRQKLNNPSIIHRRTYSYNSHLSCTSTPASQKNGEVDHLCYRRDHKVQVVPYVRFFPMKSPSLPASASIPPPTVAADTVTDVVGLRLPPSVASVASARRVVSEEGV